MGTSSFLTEARANRYKIKIKKLKKKISTINYLKVEERCTDSQTFYKYALRVELFAKNNNKIKINKGRTAHSRAFSYTHTYTHTLGRGGEEVENDRTVRRCRTRIQIWKERGKRKRKKINATLGVDCGSGRIFANKGREKGKGPARSHCLGREGLLAHAHIHFAQNNYGEVLGRLATK